MKLLIDNQLPSQLAVFLRGRGHDCVHVLDRGLGNVSDIELWSVATVEGRIVISKDEDFVYLAARSQDKGRLIWVRLGNCRNAALPKAFEAMHDDLVRAFDAGERVVEVQ